MIDLETERIERQRDIPCISQVKSMFLQLLIHSGECYKSMVRKRQRDRDIESEIEKVRERERERKKKKDVP